LTRTAGLLSGVFERWSEHTVKLIKPMPLQSLPLLMRRKPSASPTATCYNLSARSSGG